MHMFTHAILASRLAPCFQPDDLGEYIWGAVAPDVRYLAGMRRNQTHLPREQVASWLAQYPRRRSFVLGYQVHCLLDEIVLVDVIGRAFPFNLLAWVTRRKFSYQQMGLLAELFYLKTSPVKLPFSGAHNEVLDCLGVAPAQTQAFAGAMRQYLAAPSFETAFTAFQNLGLLNDSRVEKYLSAYHWVEKKRMLQSLMLMGVRNAHLEKLADGKARELVGS